MAAPGLGIRVVVPAVALLVAAAAPPAAGCLDVQWCRCDAQSTLHCLTSDESELRAVADRLAAAPRLRLADLVVRDLPRLPGGLFRAAPLHGLLLSGSRAEQLPADLLAGLEHSLLALGLGENRLARVPTATLRLPARLERLDLSGNRLRAVEAAAFPPLRNLSELNLADNEIERLAPEAFAPLPALATLSLEGNRLDGVALSGGALSRLRSLRQLKLARNLFSGALTENFISELPNLTELSLAQNNFTSVEPGALMGLTNLRVLDLSQNKIDVISDRSFSNLGKLDTLRLDNNHIVTLPSSGFSGLKALSSLDLSHNYLQSVTNEALVVLSNIRELFLRDNDIIYLDGTLFDSLLALKRLDLSENPLHCDCHLRGLASYLTASKTRLSDDDLVQVTCMTPSHLENAPLASLSPEQLTCEESVQYDDLEPRPGDASHQIRLEEAQLAADGGGARLRWRVDPALSPYRCDQVFVFEPHADHEQHVASVAADCGGAPADPTRLQVDVRWPEVRAGQPYRFCLVLVELAPAAAAALRPSCGEPVRLAAAKPAEPSSPPPPAPPEPELTAFFANMTAAGRVTVFLRVRHVPAQPCAVTVLLLDGQEVLAAEPMPCSLPLLALTAPGRPGARACVSAPHQPEPAGADGAPPPPAQCVRLRPAGGARWWQTAPAAAAFGCLLALLLVAAAGCVFCRLRGRCRLGGGYNKWAGRPGVGFVRTATQPRSASEESIHRDQEETDSQV